MFLLESNVRKILKILLLLVLIFLFIILFFEIFRKHQDFLAVKQYGSQLNYSYTNYISRVSTQREKLYDFLIFLDNNDFKIIEFNYSYNYGLYAKVAKIMSASETITSKYSMSEITKVRIEDEYFVILEIKELN